MKTDKTEKGKYGKDNSAKGETTKGKVRKEHLKTDDPGKGNN